MVSEDFLIIFMSLWELVVAANLNPRGMVGRINIVNYYASLHTTYRSCRLHGIREFFLKSYSPLYVKSIEANDLRVWPI